MDDLAYRLLLRLRESKESAVSQLEVYKYVADGEWRSAEGNRLFDVYRPYDRALYARVAAGGRAEAQIAVEAAARAFPAWSQTTPAERAKLFFKAVEIVKRRRTEIAQILALETGSTISFATSREIRRAHEDVAVGRSARSSNDHRPADHAGCREDQDHEP